MEINPVIASSSDELATLMGSGTDPIIHRDDEHLVSVFTRRGDVVDNIREGMNWHMSDDVSVGSYVRFYFSRLNEDQLMEHLVDPTKHQGSDD